MQDTCYYHDTEHVSVVDIYIYRLSQADGLLLLLLLLLALSTQYQSINKSIYYY